MDICPDLIKTRADRRISSRLVLDRPSGGAVAQHAADIGQRLAEPRAGKIEVGGTMRLTFLLALTCAGCTPTLQREVVSGPVYDRTTRTMWIVEKDVRSSVDDRIAVIVCHRDGAPACIRVEPTDARSPADYAAWLQSIPVDIRNMAKLPPGSVTVPAQSAAGQ